MKTQKTCDYLSSPSYISPSKNAEAKKLSRFQYIAESKELSGLISNACNSLNHPITIVDFNWLENNDSVASDCRIDSSVEFFALRKSCKLLRLCVGSSYCCSII